MMENSGWKEVKLGDYVDSISKTFKFTEKEVVFLNTSDVLEGKVLNKKYESAIGLPGQAKKSIQKGDLLFSEIRPANKRYARIDFDSEDYVVSTKLMVLRSQGDLDPIFLELYLTSAEILDYLQMIAEDRSGTFPQITFDIISKLELKLPPLPEQKAITLVLSSLDDKIDLLQQQNQTLEALAETLFRQWFIEEANEDWEEVTLGSLIDIFGGYSYKGNKIGQGSSYLLGMGCVSYSDRFLYSGMRKYDEEVNNKYLVEKGDIVIATRQQSDNLPILGAPAIIPVIDKNYKVIVGTNLYKVVNNSNLNYYSLYRLLKSSEYKNFIKSNAKGSTVRMITKDAILSFPILLPPNNTVNKLNKELSSLNNKIELNNNQVQILTHLRDTLLPKLMSGELKVKM